MPSVSRARARFSAPAPRLLAPGDGGGEDDVAPDDAGLLDTSTSPSGITFDRSTNKAMAMASWPAGRAIGRVRARTCGSERWNELSWLGY